MSDKCAESFALNGFFDGFWSINFFEPRKPREPWLNSFLHLFQRRQSMFQNSPKFFLLQDSGSKKYSRTDGFNSFHVVVAKVRNHLKTGYFQVRKKGIKNHQTKSVDLRKLPKFFFHYSTRKFLDPRVFRHEIKRVIP